MPKEISWIGGSQGDVTVAEMDERIEYSTFITGDVTLSYTTEDVPLKRDVQKHSTAAAECRYFTSNY